jgi:hypothetical protein
MAEKIPQTLANHTRFHPPFHFVAVPLTVTAMVMAIIHAVHHPDQTLSWMLVILTVGVVVTTFLTRISALKVQDRVIRLEERLRLASILNAPLQSRIGELTESQLIALRFAPDAECPALVEKALASKMSAKDIKASIKNWRADLFRV